MINVLITRTVGPEVYALAAVQFYLVTTTILFLSREAFRRGCLRANESLGKVRREGRAHRQDAADPVPCASSLQYKGRADVNDLSLVFGLSWLCIPLGLVIALVVCGGAIYLGARSAAAGGGKQAAEYGTGKRLLLELQASAPSALTSRPLQVCCCMAWRPSSSCSPSPCTS